ncbi:MAG: hypothetical protein ABSC26_04895, partial [Stellaceae bacterium]
IPLAIVVAMIPFASGDALAQASAPFGIWNSTAGPNTLYVTQQLCYFESRNPGKYYRIQGKCSWNPSSDGGILTIYNEAQRGAPIYENIVYVNGTTISIWGEIFRR